MPKYVASRTLTRPTWHHTTVLNGDLVDAVADLKRQPGDGELQVIGSGELVQVLLRHDLIDRLRLKVMPVLIGSGKRLFGDGTMPRGLALTKTKTTPTGAR